MILKRQILFFLILSISFSLTAKDYTQKIYLWEDVPGMETQKRDSVMYFCPAKPASERNKKIPLALELLKEDIDFEDFPEIVDDFTSGKISPVEAESGIDEKGMEVKNPRFNKQDNSEIEFFSENPVPAVIICPGGSYHHLGIPHEGFATARWFNSIGINAFVLRYRVAYNCHHYPDQLQDIQMAIHYIRLHAEEFNIDKTKIGAIGFSAGGHLVTMAGEFSSRNEISQLGIEVTESLRPDFVMPIYPVVSMQDDIGHKWSRRSLLGHQWKAPNATKGWSPLNFWGHAYSQNLKDEFSMENPDNIPEDMPPVFILACHDDPVVIYENSVRLDQVLALKGVEHIFVNYPKGGHGFGMREDSYIMKETHWNDKDLLPWLYKIGIIEQKKE